MTTNTTPTDTRRCEFEIDDPGPSAGCAEFDPAPGTIRCGAEATRALTIVDHFARCHPDATDDGVDVVYLCDTHADEATLDSHAGASYEVLDERPIGAATSTWRDWRTTAV